MRCIALFFVIFLPTVGYSEVPWQPFSCLSLEPQATWFATGSRAGEVRLWASGTGEALAVWPSERLTNSLSEIQAIAILSPQRFVIAPSTTGLRLWDRPAETVQALPGTDQRVLDLLLGPDDLWAITAQGELLRWNRKTLALEARMQVSRPLFCANLALAPDGRHLALVGSSGQVVLLESRAGTREQTWVASTDWSRQVLWTSHGLLIAGDDGRIQLWTPAGHLIWSLDLHQPMSVLTSLGETWAAGTMTGELVIGDFDAGHVQRSWSAHSAPVRGLAWLPGSQQLVSASLDSTLRLWQVSDGSACGVIQP